ncbi:hypothetical protein [Pseudomonas sp. LFM046]|uniref:hypothetical protein n=1 Tax=Pseudomonas sp. LFM046 TaxID=1608357 RepID=UPI0005CFECF5|nr:hypothetical protein [Pseudomonas sp. LFM046]
MGESMTVRTNAYLEWLEQDLPCKRINKRFPNGKEVDVRVRETPFGDIQWFIGVYDRDGSILIEQFNGAVSASSLDAALVAAFSKACGFAGVED